MKKITLFLVLIFIACEQKAQKGPQNNEVSMTSSSSSEIPDNPDESIPYYDRNKIDISNLRVFYEGLLMADLMIHADGMFDAETKWRFTLYQMIKAKSNHHIARSAYQLSLMGVPLKDILAMWSPDYLDTVKNPRIKAAYEYLNVASNLPTKVTADTHASLRMHFVDRQIAELTDLTSINASNAVHDHILPIVTDQETVDWAAKNLSSVGWKVGLNKGTKTEQHKNPFVGKRLETAYQEINSQWKRDDLSAVNPDFKTDWVNQITGYGIPRITFDRDGDGLEDPYDAYPNDYNTWKRPGLEKENIPDSSTPKFDVSTYDYAYFQPAVVQETKYPYSDRHLFDVEWTRQSSLGTLMMDSYLLFRDRAITLKMRWELFFVYQLASGCTHCQVHGSFGVFQEFESDYMNDEIPEEELPAVINYIQALMDFERSDLFSNAQKAAYRLARDAGPMPSRTTASHIEELRRYYSDREIQEILANCVLTAWLATTMQSQATVTDRKSMSWALRNLGPKGWNPGPHTGWPNEQRPYHMSELLMAVIGDISTGEVPDAASEWLGVNVPLAVDFDKDGVEDAFDGFPKDPTRWEDTDRDGIEDSKDDDIDGDGISNKQEMAQGTFPYKADSDGDGVADGTEIEAGTDPVDPHKY
ncbi:MAG: thrombospondin type 3 repeat-containing protein [Bacteroidota bacterium]